MSTLANDRSTQSSIKKDGGGVSMTGINRTKQAAKKLREQEQTTQAQFLDQDIQAYIDEIEGRRPDERAPSSRDVLYDGKVSDYDQVSDEYKKKEMQGHMRLFAHYVNLYTAAVEGQQACTVFFDESGEM